MARSFAYSSIGNYVSALVYLQKIHRQEPITASNFMVHRTLQGAKRLLGDATVQATPLEPQHLLRMYFKLDMSKSYDLVWWLAIILAFRGLLRKAHVTNTDQGICVSDLSFKDWGVLLSLPKTKTIQYGERLLEIPFAKVLSSVFCVDYYLRLHLRRSKLKGSDFLFQFKSNHKWFPMTYKRFSKTLSEMTSKLKITGKISTHSLRRGGATWLHSIGYDLVEIKTRGDWKSLAVLLYLQDGISRKVQKDKVAAAFLRFV